MRDLTDSQLIVELSAVLDREARSIVVGSGPEAAARARARAAGRPARPWMLAGVAAALVLAIVASGALLTWRGHPNAGPAASPSATPSATVTSSPSLSPSPSPSLSPTPAGTLPTLPSVPTGQWTGLTWFSVPEGYGPPAPGANGQGSYINLFGWSRGYVDFVWDGAHSVTPWASADGLHWQAGPKLPPGDMPFEFPALTTDVATSCRFEVDSWVEASAGLLAHGSIRCDLDTYSAAYSAIYSSTWTSTDGLTWSVATGVPDGELSAGGAGYIVTDGQRVWTSGDGRAWEQGTVPDAALPQGVRWGSPIAFKAGFLIGPETIGTQWPFTVNFPKGTTAGIFWSADGRSWTRQDPPGRRSGLASIWMEKMDDGTVLLREETADPTTGMLSLTAWTTSDGRSWRPVASWNDYGPISVRAVTVGGVFTPNCFALAVNGHAVVTHLDQGTFDVSIFDPSGPRLLLPQYAGEWPASLSPGGSDGRSMALGPAGLLAIWQGSNYWIGVPTAD
jgi:hypothetical protein